MRVLLDDPSPLATLTTMLQRVRRLEDRLAALEEWAAAFEEQLPATTPETRTPETRTPETRTPETRTLVSR